jgi:hypothetical protein
MTGKNGSAWWSKEAGLADASHGGKSARPTQNMEHKHLHVVRNKDRPKKAEAEKPAKMRAQRPGQEYQGGMLDRQLQAQIGRILRDSFADIEREPIPDRLHRLIEALQKKEKRR